MQKQNVIGRTCLIPQPAFASLGSVSTSIRGRNWSSFNRQFSDSSEHPSRKKSPKIMIHFLKRCLSTSLFKIKKSLLIQGSFPAVSNAGMQVKHTQNHWQQFSPCTGCSAEALSGAAPRRRHCPGRAFSFSWWKWHNAYQIANGAEIKHSF